jgi:hypothetical protein
MVDRFRYWEFLNPDIKALASQVFPTYRGPVSGQHDHFPFQILEDRIIKIAFHARPFVTALHKSQDFSTKLGTKAALR